MIKVNTEVRNFASDLIKGLSLSESKEVVSSIINGDSIEDLITQKLKFKAKLMTDKDIKETLNKKALKKFNELDSTDKKLTKRVKQSRDQINNDLIGIALNAYNHLKKGETLTSLKGLDKEADKVRANTITVINGNIPFPFNANFNKDKLDIIASILKLQSSNKKREAINLISKSMLKNLAYNDSIEVGKLYKKAVSIIRDYERQTNFKTFQGYFYMLEVTSKSDSSKELLEDVKKLYSAKGYDMAIDKEVKQSIDEMLEVA